MNDRLDFYNSLIRIIRMIYNDNVTSEKENKCFS